MSEIHEGILRIPSVRLTGVASGWIAYALLFASIALFIHFPISRKGGREGRTFIPESCDITASIEKKFASILEYGSQIYEFFPNEQTLRDDFAHYSQQLGAPSGKYYERYWRFA